MMRILKVELKDQLMHIVVYYFFLLSPLVIFLSVKNANRYDCCQDQCIQFAHVVHLLWKWATFRTSIQNDKDTTTTTTID